MFPSSRRLESADEHDPLPFIEEYHQAWKAAEQPDVDDITEVFLAALHKVIPSNVAPVELSDVKLHPLFVFMCAQIQQNVNLSWFKKFCPLPVQPERAPLPFPFSGAGSPFGSMMHNLFRMPGVEIKGIQIQTGQGKDEWQPNVTEQKEKDALSGAYCRAYILAGCPDRDVTFDTVLSAIGMDAHPPHASAKVLWTFVRRHRNKETVRWFLGYSDAFESIRKHPESWAAFLESAEERA